jgi:GAF domain-containing protein
VSDRERWLARTFVEMAGSLVGDFDVVDLLTTLCERCVDLLGAVEVGIVLVDEQRRLRAMASSTERAHLLELLELQSQEGPCLDAFQTGARLLNVALDESRWPLFSRRALQVGYRGVHAVPMRHGDQVIGAINIFDATGREMASHDAEILQALADMATIAVIQHRSLRQALDLAHQLQHALHSRVAIEQAKGILAERLHIDIPVAFLALRSYSRNQNQQIGTVARRVIDGSLSAEELLGNSQRQDRPTSRLRT